MCMVQRLLCWLACSFPLLFFISVHCDGRGSQIHLGDVIEVQLDPRKKEWVLARLETSYIHRESGTLRYSICRLSEKQSDSMKNERIFSGDVLFLSLVFLLLHLFFSLIHSCLH